jgi:hypothetical protein
MAKYRLSVLANPRYARPRSARQVVARARKL